VGGTGPWLCSACPAGFSSFCDFVYFYPKQGREGDPSLDPPLIDLLRKEFLFKDAGNQARLSQFYYFDI